MADRLCADKKYTNLARGLFKQLDILKINEEPSSQTSLYLIAMALGIHEGRRTPSESKDGLILESAYNNCDMAQAFTYSVALQELRKDGRENEIKDNEIVYQIAEEYANTGFAKLEEMISDVNNFDEENLELQLIDIMDDVYASIQNQS